MTGSLAHRTATQAVQDARAEIWTGLTESQKTLSAKFFYDRRGSELFEAITELPEYYPTRSERRILQAWMPELVSAFAPGAIVELGAGSSEKTRILLDALEELPRPRAYVPIDVSEAFLEATARRLGTDYPNLDITPVVGDMSRGWTLPAGLPRPLLFIFLGGTIGNFDPTDAERLLGLVRRAMQPDDRFLMGVDLRKDVAVVEAAYNDAQGVTAEFNLNMLRALNRQYGTTFDPSAFHHSAFYDRSLHRIEMHLVCERDHVVTVPTHGSVDLVEGETIRTEISCKHDRASVRELFGRSGFSLGQWHTDPDGRFAVAEGLPVP